MTKTYKEIINKAKQVQTNVKKEYKTGATSKWSYYFAKAIITPNKDIKSIEIKDAVKPVGSSISRQLTKTEYLDVCNRLVKFVERKHQLPNYVKYKDYKLKPHLLTEFLSRILVYYVNHKKMPSQANINSKVFTKPIETGNAVYDYACNKYGKKFTKIDDLLEYVQKHFKYQYYFDDHKSNKQVTDEKSGNCTDLLQWLCNMVEPMGYEWQCIHVKCRVSGTGHVFGKFRKKGTKDWFIRDIASVSDGGSITSVWCKDGIVLATNPSWWMANKNR